MNTELPVDALPLETPISFGEEPQRLPPPALLWKKAGLGLHHSRAG
jgi:hypothetical protein